MAVDLPSIRASLEISLDLFKAQQAQVSAALAQMGRDLESVPPARVALDTASFTTAVAQVNAQVAALRSAGSQGVVLKPQVDVVAFQSQATQVQRTAEGLRQSLTAANTTIRPQVDNTAAQQSVQSLAQALTAFQKAGQGASTITPTLDAAGFKADLAALQAVTAKAFQSFGGLSNIPGLGAAGGALAIGGGLATGAGLGLLAKQALDVAESHEAAMQRIIRATGATGPALAGLKASLETLAATGRSNVGVLGDVLSQLNVRLGLTGSAAEQLTLQIVKFSSVTGGDAGENVRNLSRIFESWGLSTKEQSSLLDTLTVAFQKTGETPGPLIEELSRFRPVLQQLGLGLTDAIVLFSQLEQVGVPAREVVIGLRQALEQFTKEGRDPATALKETIDVIQTLDEAAARAKSFETFGARSGAALLDLARSGKLSSSDLVASLEQADGALNATAVNSQTAAGRFEKAMRQMQESLLPLGAGILEASGTITDSLVPAIQAAITKVQEFNKAQAEGPISQAFNQAAAEKQKQIEELQAQLREVENARIKSSLAPPQPGSGGDVVASPGDREREESAALEAQFTKTGAAGQEAAQAVTRDFAILAAQMAASKGGAVDLAAALKAAGTDTSAISGILAWDAALKTIDTSISALTDRDLAAYIVALRNQAASTTDVAEKQAILNQAYAAASTGIEAQTAAQADLKAQADAAKQAQEAAATAAKQGHDQAAAAAKQQADAEEKLGEAIRNAPIELLRGRLNDLAQTAFPALSEAQQGLIKQFQAGGDSTAAAGVALGVLGVSAAETEAAFHGTGAEFAAFVDHLKRIADTADPAAQALKAQEASAKSMLDTLSAGLPAADRAWLQYTAARTSDSQVLRDLYRQMGGDLAAFDSATEAQQQRSIARLAQARQAAEVFHSTGRLLPAPQETDLLGPQRQQQVEDQTRAQARQADDLRVQAARTAADRQRQDADFQRQGAQIDADFAQRQTDIQNTLSTATAQISHARGVAESDFQRGQLRDLEDFNQAWVRQQRDRAQQDAESLRGLREQAGDLLVGATSQFHAAAAQAVEGLLGLSGSALGSAAAGVVDRFQGMSDAAQDAARQVTDAQQSMLDKVRDTFQQINRQASDTIKGIRDQLLQAGQNGNTPSLFGGIFTNLPGQGSAEQQAALKATADRNQAILDANLKQADTATKQQSILDTAQKARADLDKAAADADKDLQKQLLDQAKQARGQRAQMISQLTRMVEGFQRSAFQTEQQRTDQREDQGLARDRQVEDQQRAFERQVNEFLAQQRAAGQAAIDAARANERQRDEQRRQLQEQERQVAEQRRRADEDLETARRRREEDLRIAEDRFQEQVRLARHQIDQGDQAHRDLTAIQDTLERRQPGVQQNFNLPNMVLVEPATQFLDIGFEELRNIRVARTVA